MHYYFVCNCSYNKVEKREMKSNAYSQLLFWPCRAAVGVAHSEGVLARAKASSSSSAKSKAKAPARLAGAAATN